MTEKIFESIENYLLEGTKINAPSDKRTNPWGVHEITTNIQLLSVWNLKYANFYHLWRHSWVLYKKTETKAVLPLQVLGLAKNRTRSDKNSLFKAAAKLTEINLKPMKPLQSTQAFRFFNDVRCYRTMCGFDKFSLNPLKGTIFTEVSATILYNNFLFEPYVIFTKGIFIVGLRTLGFQLNSTPDYILGKVDENIFKEKRVGITFTPFVLIRDSYE